MQEPAPDFREIKVTDTIAFLKESGGDYLKAKIELASIEAKEAAEVTARKVAAGIKLAFFAFFAYLLLLATLVGAGTQLLEGKINILEQHIGTWPVVTLGLFIVHLLLVVVFIDKLKAKSNEVLFAITKAELEKDKQWLQQLKANNESNN